MSEQIFLNKKVFEKKNYEKIIDTSFSQLTSNNSSTEVILPTIDEFFSYYKELFFEIPQEGSINSHEYLVKTSGDYINIDNTNEEIQALIEEITQLRQDNLELNQKLNTILSTK